MIHQSRVRLLAVDVQRIAMPAGFCLVPVRKLRVSIIAPSTRCTTNGSAVQAAVVMA